MATLLSSSWVQQIMGAGTDVIRIRWCCPISKDVVTPVIPDRIEAGTYMIAAAGTGGERILVENVIPQTYGAGNRQVA